MNEKRIERIKKGGVILLLLVMLFEVFRSSMRNGDFIGYVRAGKLTLDGLDIYSDYLNTWPPFFSIFCVPFAWLDNLSGVVLRGGWTFLMLLALFWSMRIFLRWITGKNLNWPLQKVSSDEELSFTHPLALIPFLIIFRFVLDNQTNLQINIFLLWFCLLSIDWWSKDKLIAASLILALAISIKAYPIFLLFFFVFKKEFRMVAWSIFFLAILNGLPFLVYGIETSLNYYAHWWSEIAGPYPQSNIRNQSLFSMLRNYFHNIDSRLIIDPSIGFLPLDLLKKIGYGITGIAAIYPMYLFGMNWNGWLNKKMLMQFAFVFTAMCILSPVAWKSNFIFLYPGYMMIYYYMFWEKIEVTKSKRRLMLLLFYLSILFNVGSSELFSGAYFSDILESLSIITIATILILSLLLMLYPYIQDEKGNRRPTKSD